MYPVNLTNHATIGYAVANDEAEHRALSAMGYEPAFAVVAAVHAEPVAADPAPTVESLRAQLTARGIKFDKRWGLPRLQEALAA